ncbi:hypothetical protein ACGFX4_25890 [Kitasatospora sp. NPDC048365]|uniref:hypothetical protein n=1 Tax=Kitasatospora sp. NPDC048365 TaxID=3364050 RepID=UPI003720A3FC
MAADAATGTGVLVAGRENTSQDPRTESATTSTTTRLIRLVRRRRLRTVARELDGAIMPTMLGRTPWTAMSCG